MMVMTELYPNVSWAIIILLFLAGYTSLITVGMLHHKRKERKRLAKLGHEPIPYEPLYQPSVTIVIPAHNEQFVIAKTVECFMGLDYPHYELLVIDDRSDDETPHILEKLQHQYGATKLQFMVRPKDAFPGKAAVLNDALKLTQGEVMAVFDADARVYPDFLTEILPLLNEDRVAAVQARKVIINSKYNWLTQCQDYEYALDSHFQHGRDAIRCAVELRGNGQLIKRKALEDVNGWNELTVTDDLDLSTRLHLGGWDIRFAENVCVFEEGVTQLPSLIRQRLRWAEGTTHRYLDYGSQILFSDKTSWRGKADMIAYLVEYFFPIWLAIDYGVVLANYLLGDLTRPHLIGSLAAVPLLAFFFVISLGVSILRFYQKNPLQALWGAISTSLYMCAIWIPVVFGVSVKVLLYHPKNRVKWYKTPHTGHESPAILVSSDHPSPT